MEILICCFDHMLVAYRDLCSLLSEDPVVDEGLVVFETVEVMCPLL